MQSLTSGVRKRCGIEGVLATLADLFVEVIGANQHRLQARSKTNDRKDKIDNCAYSIVFAMLMINCT